MKNKINNNNLVDQLEKDECKEHFEMLLVRRNHRERQSNIDDIFKILFTCMGSCDIILGSSCVMYLNKSK